MTIEEGESVRKVFRMFKGVVTSVALEVVGYRSLRSHRKGGGQMKKGYKKEEESI